MSDGDEHLSKHGYFHDLLEDEKAVQAFLSDPKSARAEYRLEWDDRNDERLEIARQRVLDYAKKVFAEVQVLNFRNCMSDS